MNKLTIGTRLTLLNAVALAFIVILGGFAIYGLNKSAGVIKELGWNRMPSVVALMDMSRGQLETRVRNRSVFVYANDPNAHDNFAQLVEKKKEAYKLIEDAKAIYEPLPQIAEEEAPWKQLMDNYAAWLDGNHKLDNLILQLSRNSDPEVQKRLVEEFKQVLDNEVDPLLQKTQTPLNQLIETNKRLGHQYYLQSSTDIRHQNTIILISVAVVFILLAIFGYLVQRSITTALQSMKAMIISIEHDNDFTRQIQNDSNDEIGETAHAFNSLVKKTSQALRQIMGKVDQLNQSAESLSAASNQVAKGSANQSEATASMAASVEQMSVSIDHVSENAKEALGLSQKAGQISSDGGIVIRKTVDEMNVISEVAAKTSTVIQSLGAQSAEISTIVSTISEVAEQTNLLALNAAIEAARAGEQGRGFAVVADEVRKLAERTSRSTEEISRMVNDIQNSTGDAVSSMEDMVGKVNNGRQLATQAGTYIEEIQDSTKRVMLAVHDITDALKEQSIASQTIAQNVEQVAQMTDENSAAAGATSETARSVKSAAIEISGTVRQFKV